MPSTPALLYRIDGDFRTSGVGTPVRPYFCALKYDVCAADLKTPRDKATYDPSIGRHRPGSISGPTLVLIRRHLLDLRLQRNVPDYLGWSIQNKPIQTVKNIASRAPNTSSPLSPVNELRCKSFQSPDSKGCFAPPAPSAQRQSPDCLLASQVGRATSTSSSKTAPLFSSGSIRPLKIKQNTLKRGASARGPFGSPRSCVCVGVCESTYAARL
jgi:hypothetical protein